MDERLKQLMQELGNAINESLSDSEGIAQAIGDIKRAGYDVFLVLECTIGFNRRRDPDEEDSADSTPGTAKVSFNNYDKQVLKDMKITLPE